MDEEVKTMHKRLEALRRRHNEIDNAVRQEAQRPAPDSVTVRTLKKVKLRLKDDIEALLRVSRLQRAWVDQ